MPLDPAYPAERLRYMLDDAAHAVHHRPATCADRLPADAAALIQLDGDARRDRGGTADAPEAGRAENLAYVIYTSGSTGRPKGVMVPPRALVAMLDWRGSTGRRGRAWCSLPSINFDICCCEIFLTLPGGGTLVVRATTALECRRRRGGVHVSTVPSAAAEQLRERRHPGLRQR